MIDSKINIKYDVLIYTKLVLAVAGVVGGLPVDVNVCSYINVFAVNGITDVLAAGNAVGNNVGCTHVSLVILAEGSSAEKVISVRSLYHRDDLIGSNAADRYILGKGSCGGNYIAVGRYDLTGAYNLNERIELHTVGIDNSVGTKRNGCQGTGEELNLQGIVGVKNSRRIRHAVVLGAVNLYDSGEKVACITVIISGPTGKVAASNSRGKSVGKLSLGVNSL